MRCAAIMLLMTGGLLAPVRAEQKTIIGTPPNIRRQYMSCEETYGDSWVQCGDEQSRFCYNPAVRQSCCRIDSGYCEAGTYCAPVAGHCCLDGEDIETCAGNAGFRLPDDASANSPSLTSIRVFEVGLNGTILVTNSRSNSTSVSSTVVSNSPNIQVSVARRQHSTLAWMAAGIGAVGLFMFSC